MYTPYLVAMFGLAYAALCLFLTGGEYALGLGIMVGGGLVVMLQPRPRP